MDRVREYVEEQDIDEVDIDEVDIDEVEAIDEFDDDQVDGDDFDDLDFGDLVRLKVVHYLPLPQGTGSLSNSVPVATSSSC
jgi:hypothetical protein